MQILDHSIDHTTIIRTEVTSQEYNVLNFLASVFCMPQNICCMFVIMSSIYIQLHSYHGEEKRFTENANAT